MIPTGVGKTFVVRAFGNNAFTGENPHIDQHWLDYMRNFLKNTGSVMQKFSIGQQVFSLANGYGEVYAVDAEHPDDSHHVTVKFGSGQNEVIDYFNQDGRDLNDQKLLFFSKAEALRYLEGIKSPKQYSRHFNFYDDGTFTDHPDESHATSYGREETEKFQGRRLVKQQRMVWGY
jgi:hypothetical protein